jgi:energy-converting hydrogenase Eha subunit B
MTGNGVDGAGGALIPPTRDDALAFLARAIGPDRAASTWVRAVAAAGVGSQGGELSVDEMLKVAERLAAEPGVVGVIGTSLVVRLRTYRLMASTQQPPREKPRD